MPSGHDWGDLLRSTFHSVGREDIAIYRVCQRQSKQDVRGQELLLSQGAQPPARSPVIVI